LGDTLKQADKQFEVVLSNPTNATLGTSTGIGTIRNDDTYLFVPSEGYITPETYAGYEKLWNDEFNGTSLDAATWTRETGGGGWGNNELQYYTDRTDNAFVSNGNLTIEAKKENFDTRQYTSARLITKGKKDFTFGRVDIRAKLPKGKGIWPALWMLGKNIDQVKWPNCGELDIMEVIGSIPNRVHGTVHYGPQGASSSTQKTGTYTLPSGDFSDKFNVYSLIWTLDNMEILVNDISFFKTNRTTIGSIYPFNEPFFMIFNVAVGGNWPGSPDATTVFPQQMTVDYIRVFKKL
jgi:beta-glucanase (GH16 family)